MRGTTDSSESKGGMNLMQLTRFVWGLTLPLLLGFTTFVAGGCDWGTQEGSAPHDKKFGEMIKEGNRKFHQQLKADANGGGGVARRGKSRAKSGE
jgi:hypothetical protein